MSVNNAAELLLDDVSVFYDDTPAVISANIKVASGEFFTLLGPSGCGKTTLLRTIAGFIRQREGSITLGETNLNNIPAHRRDTGMVFQNYATFPHLSVYQNIAYGLRERKVGPEDIDRRVREAIELVELTGYEKRMPRELSGGQQQRVVIARAIVIRPRILLMDEPLANLDAKLRTTLRRELKQLQQSLGITTIYVTHDQEEALSLSDKIAVMDRGKVIQVGTPQEIYETPKNMTVARFVGEGTFLHGELSSEGTFESGSFVLQGLSSGVPRQGTVKATVCIRPQALRIGTESLTAFDARIVSFDYLGAYIRYYLDCGLDEELLVEVAASAGVSPFAVGSYLKVAVDQAGMSVFVDERTN